MTYAIVQKELVVPELESLKRAFSVWPALTGIDAQTSANDAFGLASLCFADLAARNFTSSSSRANPSKTESDRKTHV